MESRRVRALMGRGLLLMLVWAGLAPAQEARDDEGIAVDEKPSGPEPERARPAREPGAKVETVVIRKDIYSIALPSDWVLADYSEADTVLSWEVHLPGSEKRALLVVFVNDRCDPRAMPYGQVNWFRENRPAAKVETRTKPLPQLVATSPPETDVRSPWMDWYLYRSIRGRSFTIRFSCTAEDFARSEQDMLQAVGSLTADIQPWPPVPKGYKTSPQGTWLIATAPGVTASTTPILKALKEQEQRFRRDHGPLPKGDEPIVVFVHNTAEDGERIEPDAENGVDGYYADVWRRRVFAVPLDKEKPDDEGWLASCAQAVLFVARYGNTSPEWVFNGERTLARAEAITGKPLPVLDAGFFSWSKDMKLHTLDELPALRTNWDAWTREAFFYVASLHEGKYKKEYAKFLEDFAATSDGEGAFSRQLWPVGLDKLHAAAIDFTYSRIRPLEREEKKKK